MWYQMFFVPLLLGFTLGFLSKNYLNRYEKRKRFDKHMDELHRSSHE